MVKPLPPLKTRPVGCALLSAGTLTSGAASEPSASTIDDVPVPSFAIQNGPVFDAARPHGLTRFASTWAAGTDPSESRFVTSKKCSDGANAANRANAGSERARARDFMREV